jgi:hypothetical protein
MTVTSTVACTPAITATANYTINVNPLPTASAGGSVAICSDGSATVSGATATNGTILWTHNGLGTITAGTETTLTPTYTPVSGDGGNTVVLTMTVSSAISCVPAITAQANFSIIVRSLPNVSAGIDQSLCIGSTTSLSGSGASTYIWSNSVVNGQNFTPGLGTLTYTVSGTDVNGCVNTDQVDITVHNLPLVNAGPDQIVCEGTTVILTATGALEVLIIRYLVEM